MSGPRHRWGAPPSPRPRPRIWDPAEPGWVIVYGPWRRRYTAFAAWPAPRPVVVDASTPEELWGAMRSAEMAHSVAATTR